LAVSPSFTPIQICERGSHLTAGTFALSPSLTKQCLPMTVKQSAIPLGYILTGKQKEIAFRISGEHCHCQPNQEEKCLRECLGEECLGKECLRN
jgi:hypothetical protein